MGVSLKEASLLKATLLAIEFQECLSKEQRPYAYNISNLIEYMRNLGYQYSGDVSVVYNSAMFDRWSHLPKKKDIMSSYEVVLTAKVVTENGDTITIETTVVTKAEDKYSASRKVTKMYEKESEVISLISKSLSNWEEVYLGIDSIKEAT